MERHKKDIFRIIRIAGVLLFFSFGFFWRCANIAPSLEGGLKDTLPPNVVKITPGYNATNVFPQKITIEFDEYVQIKDFQKEFFTSPFMNRRPSALTKNKSVVTEIRADLDSNTTYVLEFGSSIQDNNENNPYVGLKYVFSTGNEIDSLYMSGYLEDAMTADTMAGALVLFFDPKADSIPEYDSTLYNAKPLAVGRTTPNGIFVHSNLKPMDYKIYALVDNNSNQTYDPGTDAVAFIDTVYNPLNLPAFHMWYDSTLMYYVAEPQILMRTFTETNKGKHQNLTSIERPGKQRVILSFAAADPVIEHLEIEGVDTSKIIIEQLKETKDSTVYWLNVLPEELSDTLKGSITYLRHDSAGVLYPHTQELSLIYTKPEPKMTARQRREAEKKEAEVASGEPKKLNWFQRRRERRRLKKITKYLKVLGHLPAEATAPPDSIIMAMDSIALVKADSLAMQNGEGADSTKKGSLRPTWDFGNPVTPDGIKKIKFEVPTEWFKTDSIRLTHINIRDQESEIPISIARDTAAIREYNITADFRNGERYKLMIPEGAIKTIDGNVNDTLKTDITIADISKFATVKVTLANGNPEYRYIVEVLNEGGKSVLGQKAFLGLGEHRIGYIAPGKVMVRVTEDRNGNGKWDTGDLVKRVQPEKVAFFINPENDTRLVTARTNWDVPVDIDLNELFSEYELKSIFSHYHEHEHGDEGHVHGETDADDKAVENDQEEHDNGITEIQAADEMLVPQEQENTDDEN